jgi:PAS domain S-box-containing protein
VPATHQLPSSLRAAAHAIGATRGRALQLRSIFDKSLIPMVMVDNERRYQEVNAAARLLARISLEEVRRRRIDDFTAPEDVPALRDVWKELTTQGTVSGRYHVTFPDGSTLWILFAGTANALPAQHLIVFLPADWPGDELEVMHASDEGSAPGALSARQLDVLRLVAVGASASQIAAELSISETTVRTHVKNILKRLGARNRAHAVALAMTQGLLGATAAPDSA